LLFREAILSDTDDEVITTVVKDKPIELLTLGDLLLDEMNPRFADYEASSPTQRDILNH
jgi:hypothetical protein